MSLMQVFKDQPDKQDKYLYYAEKLELIEKDLSKDLGARDSALPDLLLGHPAPSTASSPATSTSSHRATTSPASAVSSQVKSPPQKPKTPLMLEVIVRDETEAAGAQKRKHSAEEELESGGSDASPARKLPSTAVKGSEQARTVGKGATSSTEKKTTTAKEAPSGVEETSETSKRKRVPKKR